MLSSLTDKLCLHNDARLKRSPFGLEPALESIDLCQCIQETFVQPLLVVKIEKASRCFEPLSLNQVLQLQNLQFVLRHCPIVLLLAALQLLPQQLQLRSQSRTLSGSVPFLEGSQCLLERLLLHAQLLYFALEMIDCVFQTIVLFPSSPDLLLELPRSFNKLLSLKFALPVSFFSTLCCIGLILAGHPLQLAFQSLVFLLQYAYAHFQRPDLLLPRLHHCSVFLIFAPDRVLHGCVFLLQYTF